jgi:hypothetical protein
MIFKSIDNSYYIITSFKVMYSTLMRQSTIALQKNIDFTLFPRYNTKVYFLVRNPYDRLASFYRDKFILHPGNAVPSDKFRWQNCQKIFFDECKVHSEVFEEVRLSLMATTFDKFIEMLPSKYLLDWHLVPQIYSLYHQDNDENIKVPVDRILKMEEEESMFILKNNLHIDTSICENETKTKSVDTSWNAPLREIVNSLYQLDFDQLGYEMKNTSN